MGYYQQPAMGSRKGGSRNSTRRVFRKAPRDKGKISLTKYFAKYAVGDKVVLSAEPAVQKNLYHRRFHGKSCKVTGQRGSSYEVEIKDGNKAKMLIVHPIHMKRA